jgi:hypothetical protein
VVILSMYYTLVLNLQDLFEFLAIKCFLYDFVFLLPQSSL